MVLIGHSQGSWVLIALVKHEIDGKPIQSKIVSVILGGARLQVPTGKVVGGGVLKNWGLHLIDMNMAMGNLIDDVRSESGAYLRSTR